MHKYKTRLDVDSQYRGVELSEVELMNDIMGIHCLWVQV